MAIQHADNFSIYGTNANLMLNGIYASNGGVSLITDPDGISGGYVMSASATFAEGGVRRVLSSFQANVGICGRVWMPSLPGDSNHTPTMEWQDSNASGICSIGCDSTGRLYVARGGAGGGGNAPVKIASTPGPVVTATAWWHIEAYMQLNGTALTYEIRVEGLTVLSGTSTVTNTAGTFSQVLLGVNDFTPIPYHWKDFVVWDNTGSQNNTFLGSVLVTNLLPTGDVNLNWTPSEGSTGYGILGQVPPVDTNYISAPYPSIPAAYEGALSAMPPTTTSIKAVITVVRAAKSDGGDGSLQNGVVSGSTPALGQNRPITVAQTYWQDVFELDPATNNPWLPASVNAVKYTINRTT